MLTSASRAKINLHLRVLGVREDGYHEVLTLLQTIDLTDEVRVEPASSGNLDLRVVPDGIVTAGPDNLVTRAATALWEHTGVEAGAMIELEKRIPIGAGLGGGSSNAATTLVLLNELWRLRLPESELAEIAAGLGSDVPFFLAGGLAVAAGRGDILQPLPDLGDYGLVVCTPAIEVSTAEVFDRYSKMPRLTVHAPDDTVDTFVTRTTMGDVAVPPWQELENDLESVVIDEWPEIGRALAELRATAPLHAAVSGSGSSSFAVFPDLATAQRAAEGLEGDWQTRVLTFVGRERAGPTIVRVSSEIWRNSHEGDRGTHQSG